MRRAASKVPQQMKVQRRLDLLPKGDSHQQRETEATNFTTVSRTGSGRVTTFRLIAAPLICLKCEYFTFKRSLLPISISISIHLHSFIPAPSLIAAGAFLRFSFSSFVCFPCKTKTHSSHTTRRGATRIFTLNKFLVWFVPLTD